MSQKYSFNLEDLHKIGIGFLLSISGPALDFISQVVLNFDFGQYTILIYALTPVLINTTRKFISGYKLGIE